MRARLVAGIAMVALLAGCAAAPEPVPAVEQPAAARWTEPVDRLARVGAAPGCNQVGCWAGSLATLLFEVPEDASLEALTLDLGESQVVDAVDWKLYCEGRGTDEESCLRPLAAGHDPLPVHVELSGLAVGPRSSLLLEVHGPKVVDPFVTGFATMAFGSIQVTGGLALVQVPSPPLPAREVLRVVLEGHSGPCNFVEANCTHYPDGSVFLFDDLEGVVALDLVMAWTSTTPADERLAMYVYPYCGDTCPEWAEVVGVSPLRLALDEVDYPFGFRLEVGHAPLPDVGFFPAGTRTPVHIEGTVTFEPEDEIEPVRS